MEKSIDKCSKMEQTKLCKSAKIEQKDGENMTKFSRKLKEARRISGLSQEKVAEEINISRSNISKYETGELEPNIETIYKLIKIYKVSANFLFDTEE